MMNGNYLVYSIFTAKCSPASQCFRKKALAGQFSLLIYVDCYLHFSSSSSFLGSCRISEVEDGKKAAFPPAKKIHNHNKATNHPHDHHWVSGYQTRRFYLHSMSAFPPVQLSLGTTDSGKPSEPPFPPHPYTRTPDWIRSPFLPFHSPLSILSIVRTMLSCKHPSVSFCYQILGFVCLYLSP